MKTNGLICARTRYILLVLALFATTTAPAFSQVSFTSQGNSLFMRQGNETNSGFEISYAEVILGISQRHSASSIFFPVFASENINAGGNISSHVATETENILPVLDKTNENRNVRYNISFKPTAFTYPKNSRFEVGVAQYAEEQLILYAKSLKEYAKKNGYDTTYAFFGNMGMLCNKKRFYVVNMVTMKIEQTGLVSHGRGQGSMFDKQYSNTEGSKCTSLGRYKIGGKYKGGYGSAYKMVGLDSTNKNAYNRHIVLHSMNCIPDIENIMPACVSEGCPSVSTKFLSSLSKIIDSRKKPVLLWLFDSNLEEAIVEETLEKEKLYEPSYISYTIK